MVKMKIGVNVTVGKKKDESRAVHPGEADPEQRT